MLTGYPLEVTPTAATSAPQEWYGYDEVVDADLI